MSPAAPLSPRTRDEPISFEQWGDVDPKRLELLERLGAGGMGEVRKAWDSRSFRMVAVKTLRGCYEGERRRFAREARALASCDHPSICRVHGFIAIDGQPSIVLQYVSGGTLQSVAPYLSMEERVHSVQRVARALAHAHARGLVHFDVKPSNILVELEQNGGVRPYLADFGSARERGRTVLTESGMIGGTPEYLAPELAAANGGAERADARADIYGLGATLYHVVAGRPPFRGSTFEVLKALANGESCESLRVALPGVHEDLARVVEKAMQRDPQLRYATADELAHDLESFLEGRPVSARDPGVVARAASHARKDLVSTGALVVIVVVAILAAAVAYWSHRRHAIEMRQAETYVRDVERLEGLLRQGAVRPLHDLEEERGQVEKRLAEIEAALPGLRGRAAIVAHYALGRGYLGLGRYAIAREHLQRAWDEGDKPADLALALGRALGESYRAALDETASIGDAKERAEGRTAIERELRDPALRLLRDGSGAALDAPELLEAQIALYEDRFSGARELARRAYERTPGLFEARRLEGDVDRREGVVRMEHGDYAGAHERFASAGGAYDDALREAPSDRASLEGACARWNATLSADYDQSRLALPSFTPALAACEQAQLAARDSVAVQRATAEVLGVRARFEAEHGLDAHRDYERAIKTLEGAIRSSQRPAAELIADLGERQRLFALYQDDVGGDAPRAIDDAVRTLERASDSPDVALRLIKTLGDRLLIDAEAGRATEGDVARARSLADRLIAARPDAWQPYNALGRVLSAAASVAGGRGEDSRALFDQAVTAYRVVQRLNPNTDYGYYNACSALQRFADLQMEMDVDPRPTLDAARAECRRGLALDSNYAASHTLLADVEIQGAVAALQRGADIRGLLEEATRELDAAVAIDPLSVDASEHRATIALLDARARAARGEDATAAFGETERRIDRGRALLPKNHWQEKSIAELSLERAKWSLAHRRPAGDAIDRGLAAAHEHLAARPFSPRVLQMEGELHLVAARATQDRAERAAHARAAVVSLEGAIRMNGHLARIANPLLADARALAIAE